MLRDDLENISHESNHHQAGQDEIRYIQNFVVSS